MRVVVERGAQFRLFRASDSYFSSSEMNDKGYSTALSYGLVRDGGGGADIRYRRAEHERTQYAMEPLLLSWQLSTPLGSNRRRPSWY